MKLLSALAIACDKAYSEHTFKADDVECAYFNIGGKHIYAIRGTETQLVTRGGFIDLLRSLLFWQKDNIHYGYKEGWEAVSKDILEHYHAQPRGALYLVGHSLGGSIALAGLYDLLEAGAQYKSIGCVTFGSPRSVDLDDLSLDLRGKINDCLVEVTHSRDPVPNLFRFAGYDWGDEPYYIDGKRKAKWWRRSLKYHSMDSYIKELQKRGY
jgi:pimeloyl-ACP methyl ester carboxylesterase